MANCKKSRGLGHPKMKSKRASLKRFSVTASGLIKFARKGKSHILSNKSRKRKRQLLKAGYMQTGCANRIKRALISIL